LGGTPLKPRTAAPREAFRPPGNAQVLMPFMLRRRSGLPTLWNSVGASDIPLILV